MSSNREWTACVQRRVDVFLKAFKDLNLSLDDDDKITYIDQFETSADIFKARPGLSEAYWYLRGAAEAMNVSLVHLIEENCKV